LEGGILIVGMSSKNFYVYALLHEADHSPPSIVAVKNAWSFAFMPCGIVYRLKTLHFFYNLGDAFW
jgi:hypothetical protein